MHHDCPYCAKNCASWCALGSTLRHLQGEEPNIQRIFIRARAVAVVLVCCAIPTLAQTPFKAPEVISATDIPYPIQSIADGVVVLDVSLDDKGAITGSTVMRDIPSLTSAATSSIRSWKFTPAST